MVNEIKTCKEFAERMVKLAEDFDPYEYADTVENDDSALQNIKEVEHQCLDRKTEDLQKWLEETRDELKSKIDKEDPDYLGQYIVECDRLLRFLERLKTMPIRYSDVLPYEERRYWYFTTHGIGPGTLPKDLNVLETRDGKNDKGTVGTYVLLDGVLNTSELKEFDIRELVPKDD